MLVTAFYNMADTFFVGMLRSNAAWYNGKQWVRWFSPVPYIHYRKNNQRSKRNGTSDCLYSVRIM